MLCFKILAVGSIKECFFREAVNEYLKRLKPYCKIQIEEITNVKITEKLAFKEKDKIIFKEGEKLLKFVSENDFIIALDLAGEFMSSEKFAEEINLQALKGQNKIIFVIGGAFGISQNVLQRANLKLSFSKMTYTHQLARVILLEQLYRVMKINNNEPYHY